MDYTDIHRCMRILNEKPKWFFQKENIDEKLQCFNSIQQVGHPSLIYSLFRFLRSDNSRIQAKAAETVLCLFAKLKSLNDYAATLKHMQIEKSDLDFFRIDFDEKTYVQLLGIASLNSNGYIREKAIKELARIKNAEGLKFILLRLGDWVAAVRKSATEAVTVYLNDEYIDELLQQLPTINRLLKIERVDLSEIHTRIMHFILNQNFTEDFYSKIIRLDDKVRLQFYKNLLNSKSASNEKIHRIVEDRNFLVRIELIKHLAHFDPDIQKEVLKKFLQDHSAAVRQSALYASKSFRSEFEDQMILLLSDEAAPVRELSRHLLKDKVIDFAQFYRQRIADKELLSGSLLGLSETGNQEDLPMFEKNIHAVNNKHIVASLIAINKFHPDNAKNHALELLVHKSKKVRNKAIEILAKNIDAETTESVRGIYEKGDYEIKKSVLKLYNKIGGWSIIGDLLLGLKEENLILQNLAWQLIEKWKSKAIRLFTTPTKDVLERANLILSNIKQDKLKMTPGRTKLLQDLKFYLR